MLNTNDAQRKKYAAKQNNLKLRYEALLIPSLLVMFREYGKEFEQRYADLGILPDLSMFQDKIKEVLQPHYNKVADAFSQQIVKELGKPANHDKVLDSIIQQTQVHHEITADQSSSHIADTTQKEAHKSISKTTEEAAAAGVVLTRAQIARKARIDLTRTNINRTTGIAITETQSAAEHAKQAEINSLDFHGAVIGGVNIQARKKQKLWDSILDNKTRPAHAEADQQMVPFDALYIVGGEKLMYPRDTSHGASLWNVINCRCTSTPIIR